MAATPTISVAEQLDQLEAARNLVLGDSAYYTQIVEGILPIIGAGARVELRRWGADFLAETFASPTLAADRKASLALVVLETLKDLLEVPGEDVGVIKSVIQTAASLYSFVFRYIVSNQNDEATWEKMAAIKSDILKRWDTAPSGVRICCIKFVQKVVQVQTPGPVGDPRRPDLTEISLSIVPADHPLIPSSNLEAQASGLLDRLLDVFNQSADDAILINSTLNCLAVLIHTRPTIATKILNAILNFNPVQQWTQPITPKKRVIIKSMERTARAVLLNANKRNLGGPLTGRIQQYIERSMQYRIDVFDESSRKRAAPNEAIDGLDNAKRARLATQIPTSQPVFPPLPPGPTSFAQLYTLTADPGFTSFDVRQLPVDLIARIILPLFQRMDEQQLGYAIQAVRERFDLVAKSQPIRQSALPSAEMDDEDEDYEPDYQPAEDIEQVVNNPDSLAVEAIQLPPEVPLGQFKIPQPPPMTEGELVKVGKDTVGRVFSLMGQLEESTSARKHKTGMNRLAGNNYDQLGWMTVVCRLATRPLAGLDVRGGDDSKALVNGNAGKSPFPLTDNIRETLFLYILEDFRKRIAMAISWLNEEWFNDRMQKTESSSETAPSHYEYWVLRILDGLTPYLDAKDKILIRFLSEIPTINVAMLQRVKGLAQDPERVSLAVNSLHYLILLKPPARKICIDALEDLYRDYDEARNPAKKLLLKWRPQAVQESKPPESPAKEENGTELTHTAQSNPVAAAG